MSATCVLSFFFPALKLILFVKVAKAKEAEDKIDAELKTLEQTLADIEEARPFDQLTVSRLVFRFCASFRYILRPTIWRKHTPESSRLSKRWSGRASGLCQVCGHPLVFHVVLMI